MEKTDYGYTELGAHENALSRLLYFSSWVVLGGEFLLGLRTYYPQWGMGVTLSLILNSEILGICPKSWELCLPSH